MQAILPEVFSFSQLNLRAMLEHSCCGLGIFLAGSMILILCLYMIQQLHAFTLILQIYIQMYF